MASNIFSRLVPTGRGRSFYDELRARDHSLDPEERAALALDEENLNEQFHDYDLENADGGGSRMTAESSPNRPNDATRPSAPGPRGAGARWLGQDDDGDNDVPASLLVEPNEAEPPINTSPRRARPPQQQKNTPMPGPATRRNRAQWETTQDRQRLHQDDRFGAPPGQRPRPSALMANVIPGTAREKAMWRWVNVSNLDNFIQDVYDYYQSCGIWCILLGRALHLVHVAFVAVFLTFLTQCVDYSRIPNSKSMSQILIPQCTKNMSGLWNLGLWLFAFYFIWKSIQWLLDLRRLFNIRDFYTQLLGIPEHDMQTVSWQDVVARIMALRDDNPKTAANLTHTQRKWLGNQSKERLDAHDMANRLMRRDNYLIALINKDILDLTVPIPFLGSRQVLSRTLEWTLMFSILDFVFNERGQVHQEFLRAGKRGQLSQKLRARFMFAGFMNLALAPFLTCYLVVVYFLTYYNEYQKNPSALGARAYTPLAEWKFREFNELPHLFKERVNMSYPFATRYVDQFPKVKTEQVARTVAFVAGAMVTVLAIASLIDPEMFLGFEITQDRTVLFYLGVFGTVWAVARGSISEDNSVFDPEYALRNVIEYTHYQPDHWQGRLHSHDVKLEFSELYKIKIVIFLEEILSILITPLVLFTSLPRCSDQVIDFFREFTIHVDGLGYVCSFAVFDFKKGVGAGATITSTADRQPLGAGASSGAATGLADVRDDYYATKHGKMAASYYGFLDNYVINPKTGIPGHLPPGMRHQFHPPPAFPGLGSPTLAADMAGSRMMGRSERGRNRSGGAGGAGGGGGGGSGGGKTPRFGPAPPTMSPMASILLDPHHQPSASGFGTRSMHRPRTRGGGGYGGGDNIIEESLEDDDAMRPGRGGAGRREEGPDEDAYEGGAGGLDESAWQTSPAKEFSRENSGGGGGGGGAGAGGGAGSEEPEVGVLGLMYQFQHNMGQHRLGGGGVR